MRLKDVKQLGGRGRIGSIVDRDGDGALRGRDAEQDVGRPRAPEAEEERGAPLTE